MHLAPVAGDVEAAGDPDAVVAGGVVEEAFERSRAARAAGETAMQPHHLMRGRFSPSRYSTSKLSFK